MKLEASVSLLKTGIELFGIRDGFSQWFRVTTIWPIQQFVWLNITHKSYCTYHGWHCEISSKECNHPKLYKREDILKHLEEMGKEMRKVYVGKDGMCMGCGEFKGIETIPDPNTGLGSWKVCVTCRKIINAYRMRGVGISMMFNAKTEKEKEYARRLIKKAEAELEFLSAESFTPTFSMIIRKRDD